MNQTILVIGSGCRETIIVKKLVEDSKKINVNLRIICYANCQNPYLIKHSTLHIIKNYDKSELLQILDTNNINFCIIGPEAPLEKGFSDILENKNIPCIGPLSNYAKIETSKSYARNFIKSCNLNVHSPNYIFLNKNIISDEVLTERIKEFNNKIVIKKDGLCGGKGVFVEDIDFTKNERNIIIKKELQTNNLLIEEKLEGREFSLMTLTDGFGNCGHFPPVCDYKRLENSNQGPNTGSMGCFIDKNNSLPFLNNDNVKIAQNINKTIIEKLNLEMKDKCLGYRGILYGSFMKTNDGKIYIIEFNSRFGDPESVIALSLLKNNFYSLL